MSEDMQDDVPESKNSVEDQRLKLKLEIEEKKFHSKIEHRPLFWYGSLVCVTLLITVLGSITVGILGSSSYFGGMASTIAVISGIIFIALLVGFFSFDFCGGPDFFDGPYRIKQLISSKEHIELLQTQLQLLEDFQTAHRPRRDIYASDMSQIIQQYTRKANRNRRFYYILQIIIIFCSLLVTGLTSGLTGLITILGKPWVTPAISFAVSFLTAMVTLFRFRERGHNLQLTADAVQYEISCATKGIYGYKHLTEEDAYTKLAEEVERLINEQRKRQQQLEQASDTKQTSE